MTITSKREEENGGKEDKNYNVKMNLDSNVYSPGDTVMGRIYLENKGGKDDDNIYYEAVTPEDINKIEVRLYAVERATTSGYKGKGINIPIVVEETKFEKSNRRIDLDACKKKYTDDEIVIAFDVDIPKDAKKSYKGKLSSYYWLVNAKLDMPLRKDRDIHSVIEIAS